MIEKLSFGGGIVYLKENYETGSFIDMELCSDFSLAVLSEEKFYAKYFSDSLGNLIEILSTEGEIESLQLSGSFICDSLSRNLLQKIWFKGENVDTGTELFANDLVPVVSAIKFLSVPLTGPRFCLTLPAISLKIEDALKLMGHDEWRNVNFSFTVLFSESISTIPTLRVEEENETLPDFCS